MMELPIYSDEDMADAISQADSSDLQILVVANGYTAVLAMRTDMTFPWSGKARGDFGLLAGTAAQTACTRGHLWWHRIDTLPTDTDLNAISPKLTTTDEITQWLETADSLTSMSGRDLGASQTALNELGNLAAWRCQFSGCGKDLIRHGASGTKNKSSYFAHIVAASPKGPRGDALLSGQKAADPSNYLLLCDDCHRLIDKTDPKRFEIALLQKMRETSLSEVRRLLDSLQYPEAIQVAVMGNITGQSSQFVVREAEEAMWERGLKRHHSLPPQYFFENGWTLHDPVSSDYWTSLFANIAGELPQLRKFLHSHGENGKNRLAVFPVHGTSILILAGRVFGEAAAVDLFQFRRQQPASQPGGRWHLEDSDNGDKFTCAVLQDCLEDAEEACLIVGLTFDIDVKRLAPNVQNDGVLTMPTLLISSTEQRNHDIVRSESDLHKISEVLGSAIQKLQDQWKVKKIHLFVGAPATVCFKLGQKLQARHHAIYLCYEAMPGPNNLFAPTIEISNDRVVAVQSLKELNLI